MIAVVLAAIISILVLRTVSSASESVEPGAAMLPPAAETGRSAKPLNLAEKLGPLVVNKDGTTNRIANWAEMTKEEKETTMRVITARNRRRLSALNTKQEL